MEIVRRDYPDLPQPAGAFHHSVRWGNLLFIAGSTARGTPAEKGDIAAQTEAIIQKFQRILEANGASLENIVKVTSFVTDLGKRLPAVKCGASILLEHFLPALKYKWQLWGLLT
jgi:enamine deaminase RidA (YjgF/YER057c/UK114 family)